MRASQLAPSVRSRRGSLRPVAAAAGVLWRFSRPHTLIGTTVGIAALYSIAVSYLGGSAPWHLWWVLVAGWCVNVFIVGVNQIEDVELDRVNKPHLPIAAGELSVTAARRIVIVAALIALALAATQGAVELAGVGVSLLVGAAYSLPPLHLKRFALPAAVSVALVRAAVLNVVVWVHFSEALGHGQRVGEPAWALTALTIPFSLAIALLKDTPDVEGDRRFGIATFSVRLGPAIVLWIGVGAIAAAAVGLATAAATLLHGVNAPLLVAAALVGIALLVRRARTVDAGRSERLAAFYAFVWRLFFAWYVVVAVAYVLG